MTEKTIKINFGNRAQRRRWKRLQKSLAPEMRAELRKIARSELGQDEPGDHR